MQNFLASIKENGECSRAHVFALKLKIQNHLIKNIL